MRLPAHVALVNFNEPLLTGGAVQDLSTLEELAPHVNRLSVLIITSSDRADARTSGPVTLIPVRSHNRADVLARVLLALSRLHRTHPIDIIQAQDPTITGTASALAARWTRSRLVVGVFGSDPGDPAIRSISPLHRLGCIAGRHTLRVADRVQVDSTELLKRMRARGITARYKPMSPNDLDRFLAASARRVYRDPAERVLFVGRLAEQKRLDVLLRGFQLLRADRPRARLTMVGDGPEATSVGRLAAELHVADAVDFRGTLDRARLLDAYLDADALAMTSYFEGMPRAFLEAAATGLPIVSTPVAGALELRSHAPITLMRAEPGAIAAGLAAGLGPANERREIGLRLEAWVRTRLEMNPTEMQLDIWKELLGG
jgi:glycosyltransferase involved in cell wall biosynthesis